MYAYCQKRLVDSERFATGGNHSKMETREKNPAPTFFLQAAPQNTQLFSPLKTSKQHPIPPIFLDIVYWARVHAVAGREAGRNFGGLHTFLSSTLKRLEDRSFFSFGRPTAHASFAKEEESSRSVCVCGKSKGVWGEMSCWECFPSFHLLKGQCAVGGFEGGEK